MRGFKLCFLFIFAVLSLQFANAQTLRYGNLNVKPGERINALVPTITGGTFSGKTSPKIFKNINSGKSGTKNGASDVSKFQVVDDIKIDKSGNLYVTSGDEQLVRKISPNGIATTFAGNGREGMYNRSLLNSALGNVNQLMLDPRNDNVYISSENYGYRSEIDWVGIKKLNPKGFYTIFSDLLGISPVTDFFGKEFGWKANNLNRIDARTTGINDMVMDRSGNIYYIERNSSEIRVIYANGYVKLLAGDWWGGYADGTLLDARFSSPQGIAIHPITGNLYVSDTYNHCIRIINLNTNMVSTLTVSTSGDQNGNIPFQFRYPGSLSFDKEGNLYVIDRGSSTLKKINNNGLVTTFAGGNTSSSRYNSYDLFSMPSFGLNALEVDQNTGNVYVSSYNNIFKISNTKFTITPNLPSGLIFNEETGVISGKTDELINAMYTVTGYTNTDSVKATFRLKVNGAFLARTDSAIEIMPHSVKLKGTIVDGLNGQDYSVGFLMGTDSLNLSMYYGLSNTKDSSYSSIYKVLKESTKYFYRFYVRKSNRYEYGEIKSFTTLSGKAILDVTTPATDISYTSATLGGNVLNFNNDSIYYYNIRYGTSRSNLNTEQAVRSVSRSIPKIGNGAFSVNLLGLKSGTTYYATAKVLNSTGEFFALDTVSFTTLTVPITVAPTITSSAEQAGIHSVLLKSNISSDGGAAIAERGFLISTSDNLTDLSYTIEGNPFNPEPGSFLRNSRYSAVFQIKCPSVATGNYDTTFTQLAANTTYYMRAYAKNVGTAGVGYGPVVSFTTTSSVSAPFSGAAITLPGRIEAEKVDEGDEGVAYHEVATPSNPKPEENQGLTSTKRWDAGNLSKVEKFRSTGLDIEATGDNYLSYLTSASGVTQTGYQLSFAAAGEWVNYSVNVKDSVTRKYKFVIRASNATDTVSANTTTSKFSIEVDGVDVTGPVVILPTGGWGKYTNTVIDSISLSPGSHVIKLKMLENGTQKTGSWQWISGAWKYVIDGTTSTNAVANFNYIDVVGYNPKKTPTKFLNLNLNFSTGDNIRTTTRTATVRARGLKPFSIFKIWLHSTPTNLATGETDANGDFEQLISIPDNTPTGKHSIDVVAVDSDNSSIAESAYIVVNNTGVVTDIVNEELGNQSSNSIDLMYSDNTDTDSTNTYIGRFISMDRAGDIHYYSLTPGTGDTDNNLFKIQNDSLILTTVADFETRSNYNIRVRSTDNTDNTYDQSLSITLRDNTNEPAGIKSNGGTAKAVITMAENVDSITTVKAYDPKDLTQTYIYSIESGEDVSRISIDESTGKLTFNNLPDYENPIDSSHNNTYKVTVKAINGTDFSLTYQQDITINITDTSDVPTVTNLVSSNITSNKATIAATVTDRGGQLIERGVIYSVKLDNQDPLLGDGDIMQQNADTVYGDFSFDVELSPNTTYVFKAFATNAVGTSYSSPVEVVTNDVSQLPIITYESPVTLSQNSEVSILPSIDEGIVPAQSYGSVDLYAGSGVAGANNATKLEASFNTPMGMTLSNSGEVLVADAGNHQIRKIQLDSLVETLAGTVAGYNNEDTAGVAISAAKFNTPAAVATDLFGNIYVADKGNNQIRKISTNGKVYRVAGSDASDAGGNTGNQDGIGIAAQFNQPEGLYLDYKDNVLYVADKGNNTIRKIDLNNNEVTTIAGNGTNSSVDNTDFLQASFNAPTGITKDARGNIFVTESTGNKIRKIDFQTPGVTTIASSLNAPAGITVDALGNIYFAESGAHKIKKIDTAGVISVFAGSGTAGSTDGVGASATFNKPYGLLLNAPDGVLYVSHASTTSGSGNRIRAIGLTGFLLMDSLPKGLAFKGKTGEIAGIPTEIKTARDYRVLFYTNVGSDTTSINLEVIANSHSISYAGPKLYKTVFPITPLSPVVTGPAFAGNSNGDIYTVSPALPNGLAINAQTGIISGTPLAVTASKKYTITAWDGTLKTSASLVIEVELGAVNPTISFENISKTYGDASFTVAASSNSSGAITYTSSNSNVATISGNSVIIIGAGTATITATQAEATGYFAGTASSTLTVGKAPLTITAQDASRCYAATDPSLTVTYAGFKLDDNAASLTTKPSVTTSAVNTSVAGDYKTIASGAEAANYDFVYVDGKFTVNPLPVGTVTSSVDYVCDGATLALNITGGANYVWYKNNVAIAGATTGTNTINSTGDYKAKLVSAAGCEAMSTNILTIKQYYAPVADFTSQYYCVNKPVYITNKSTSTTAGPVKYLWEDGAGYTSTATSPTFTYTSTGNKTIKLTVTPDYCPALKQTVSKVVAIEAPTAPVRLATQDAIVREAFTLNTRSIATATSYLWSPSMYLLDARVLAPTAVLEKETNFTLQTTVASSCTTTDSLLVRVFTETDIHLPTVFSPNGDGLNDKLQLNLVLVENLQWFRVYDRYNTLVFETKDKLGTWDGTFNNSGTPLPVDTYFWVVSGTDNYGKAIHKTGAIVLSK